MRIIQISDLHIDAENEHPNEVDVRKNFLKVLRAIPEYDADFIVVSGDLSYRHGNKVIYRWIRDQLEPLGLPVYVIAGNHDDPVLLAEVFHPDKITSLEGKLYYFCKKDSDLFLFLDSGDGYMRKQQYKWAEEVIQRHQTDRLFIFMHHPPFRADVPHMDGKHAFQEPGLFEKFAAAYEKPMHLFTGHYHFQKTIQKANISLHICPSTFFQMKGDKVDFEKDHSIPGFQLIDITSDQVAVHAHYVH